MLTPTSPASHHYAQNIALILLSLFFLPLDTFILFLSYVLRPLFTTSAAAPASSLPATRRKTILVTGVGMTKGLSLARLFHTAGHRVVGADFEPGPLPALVCGRVSAALASFYRLATPAEDDSGPYIASLLEVIQKENVDLWVSCSGVASAISDGEAKEVVEKRTRCRAVQFDVRTTETLHEKDRFIARCRELGLLVPETITVASKEEIEGALRDAKGKGKEFIMKSIALDDASRADMTLLPRPTPPETRRHIDSINISPSRPWILQEFIGGPEFCTHALVVEGKVKAFVACPSAELLMHYEALPHGSALSRAMLAFTRRFADAGGNKFTGHLSFDFLVKEEDLGKERPEDIRLYPIECNPRAHTAVALFSREVGMVDGYLDLLNDAGEKTNGYDHTNGVGKDKIVTPKNPHRYYWVGHDLVTRVLLPLLHLLRGEGSLGELAEGSQTFLGHVVSWKDGTYEVWDPLPWWWLYHVYWPTQFLNSILSGRRWSRMNVSTTKMFGVDGN